MKVGIVSDTHGRADRLGKAMARLRDQGAEVIVHCGDVGNSQCIAVLGKAGLPAYAVAGNMDCFVEDLETQAQENGVHFHPETILVPLEGQRHLAVTHGDSRQRLYELIVGGRYAYVCHGHTHVPHNKRVGGTRVINPGALCCTGSLGVALLDTDADTVEHIDVE